MLHFFEENKKHKILSFNKFYKEKAEYEKRKKEKELKKKLQEEEEKNKKKRKRDSTEKFESKKCKTFVNNFYEDEEEDLEFLEPKIHENEQNEIYEDENDFMIEE